MFMDTSSMNIESEFIVILLAGYGNGLYPLTENNLPKALLPVQNNPLIHHSLKWIENSGVKKVIIAVYPEAHNKISMFTEQFETSLDIQVHAVKEGCGSADALRQLKSLIKTDFIIFSCDLITDIPPHYIINSHRAQNNSMTAFYYDALNLESPERMNKDDGEIIAIHPKTSRLLLTISMADVQSDQIEVKNSILSKFGNVQIYTHLRDAHLYVFKKWVIDLVAMKQKISSIKYDLIPLLLKCQHSNKVFDREGIHDLLQDSSPDLFAKARLLSISGNNTLPQVLCSAIVYRDGFTARTNTVFNYSEVNRALSKINNRPIPATTIIDPKTQVGNDSLIGDGCTILERCSIKRSVIGNHVTIGKNCKISNCVIMDYVRIEDGVKLDACVVCANAKVNSNTSLKDCEVSGNFVVPHDTQGKGEQFVTPMVNEE